MCNTPHEFGSSSLAQKALHQDKFATLSDCHSALDAIEPEPMSSVFGILGRRRKEALEVPKIFCISFQRTGTTSVGRFFEDHGYPVGTWQVTAANEWSLHWFKGDYERIFSSPDFQRCQVFEDGPWGGNEFYKFLFHRFPDARFVHLVRPADKWFDSMVSHSNGLTLGNTHRHAYLYDRLEEYHALGDLSGAYTSMLDNLLPLAEKHRAHYEAIYTSANREIRLFFDRFGTDRLFRGELTDPDLWERMGAFFKIPVKEGYGVHANASQPQS